MSAGGSATGRVAFVSPMSLLDRGNGAAVSVATWLRYIAEAGMEAHAVTMALFDRSGEYPLEQEVGSRAAAPENQGKLLRLEWEGIHQHIFYTRSTQGTEVSRAEAQAFLERAASLLAELRPDVVISFGSSAFSRQLQAIARARCRRFVFYLPNPEFDDPHLFASSDRVVCPSRYLADLYRRTLGLDPDVLGSVILPDRYLPPGSGGIPDRPETRDLGFITLINPIPAKGLTLFWQLLRMAARERPDWTFLAVEGRMGADTLRGLGTDIAGAPNAWLVPRQRAMRRVYARTTILLVPSFWQEAAGRVVPEAQLSGIPVLGANRGGIPEQMNGAGYVLDVPAACRKDFGRIPTEAEVRPWMAAIARLLDDGREYRAAVARAQQAAEPFEPERRRAEVVAYFKALAAE